VAARHADATPSLDRAMEFAVAPGGPACTVTVRDGKRFAGPLALPRSCPLYVRDHWTSRMRSRKPW
jgi:hypothetical protein